MRLASESKPGRFTLYLTSNIFTFMLLDQKNGYTWQVQWGLKPEERCEAATAPQGKNPWVNFGRPAKASDADFFLAAARPRNLESRLHPHERVHLHAESLLYA
jgi:hypothetical protein